MYVAVWYFLFCLVILLLILHYSKKILQAGQEAERSEKGLSTPIRGERNAVWQRRKKREKKVLVQGVGRIKVRRLSHMDRPDRQTDK